MTTPRAHADIATLYFSDNEMKCWHWLPGEGRWIETDSPTFIHECTFHVGKEAPTEPPQIMCELAGVKFPMPAQSELKQGETYFVPDTSDSQTPWMFVWKATELDKYLLEKGLVQHTKEGASQQSLAAVEALRQAVQKAKERMK